MDDANAHLNSCVGAPVIPAFPAGCADGTREGFVDAKDQSDGPFTLYPKIAACAGPAAGVDVSDTVATQPFCAEGWHVCTGSDVNAGRNDASHHTAVTREMATGFDGCFAYNANNGLHHPVYFLGDSL